MNTTRPGDVLIVSVTNPMTPEDIETLRAGFLERLPGLADVLILYGARVEAAYRPDDVANG